MQWISVQYRRPSIEPSSSGARDDAGMHQAVCLTIFTYKAPEDIDTKRTTERTAVGCVARQPARDASHRVMSLNTEQAANFPVLSHHSSALWYVFHSAQISRHRNELV